MLFAIVFSVMMLFMVVGKRQIPRPFAAAVFPVMLLLFESDNSNGYMHGFTGNYLKVKTPFRTDLVNKIISVPLDKLDEDGVFHYSVE